QPDPTNQLGETTSNPATEEVLLYPNPTSEVITILFNPEQQYERVTITDLLGKVIFEQPIFFEQTSLVIPVGNKQFHTGIYNVVLSNNKKTTTRKVMVLH
ncbi:MAG: T9SS type A sorting domain-containing protein, partial [Saprospiraceae bacterium]